ncbi:hypothetical protein HanPSC8_Chr05g0196201 [Helianthus annuus]|nr:hypothetical protein HanPSC8_Chr05g0196201 [Helianthus annuus]
MRKSSPSRRLSNISSTSPLPKILSTYRNHYHRKPAEIKLSLISETCFTLCKTNSIPVSNFKQTSPTPMILDSPLLPILTTPKSPGV